MLVLIDNTSHAILFVDHDVLTTLIGGGVLCGWLCFVFALIEHLNFLLLLRGIMGVLALVALLGVEIKLQDEGLACRSGLEVVGKSLFLTAIAAAHPAAPPRIIHLLLNRCLAVLAPPLRFGLLFTLLFLD